MRHLSLQQLSACVDDSLSGVTLEIVESHLSGCGECRARQVRLQRVDGLLVQMIRPEAGEAWLGKVAAEIADRLRDEIDGTPGGPTPPPTRTATREPHVAIQPSRESLASASPLSASAPGAGRALESPHWQVHAERIARARRDAAGKPREALLPLLAGLTGGAVAGALVVTLVFGQRPALRAGRADSLPASSSGETAPSRIPIAPEVAALRAAVIAPPAVVPVEPPAPARSVEPPAPARSAVAPSKPDVRVARPAPAPTTAPASDAYDGDWPMLCGIVVDEAGAAISEAHVQFADLELSTRTDRRGRFCISGPAGYRTMSVVALGYSPRRQAVNLAEVTPELSITLRAVP